MILIGDHNMLLLTTVLCSKFIIDILSQDQQFEFKSANHVLLRLSPDEQPERLISVKTNQSCISQPM